MSAKAPIYLKRRSRKGKKEKLRDLLSSDMISPPLGDFRHTIHIGSGGGADDLFGDLSFLQGKFHLLPGQQGLQALSQYGGGDGFQFSRTSSVSTHVPSSESSPLLKNAMSLPVIGGVQALTLPNTSTSQPAPPVIQSKPSSPPPPQQAPPPKPPRLHLEDRSLSSSPPPPVLASPERPTRLIPSWPVEDSITPEEDGVQESPYLSHAGSLLSLHLDLGPSILDEVLQIMDSQRMGGLNGGCLSGGRQEIYT
ncbi:cdc42 effector protein 2-like [Denticeps clupeoides]|uniref:CRIB domain-containing protein n=1 Tax=Denticeps clupeoides TaxID=299321 RepID=A0A8C4CSE8_9TELE|nr:cdc42 effector protein 2-like [Denticeps clupeoides]XP_028821497.1 cdc42 effector protein 2-like [Denticeps clupeoides]XP_028821498.1 cdc42 effector protein 2-like [Denticeps clupeoides]XP_028821499.1 cdc42 effector protein 2-like [Denticeps clupeoides]XP_028840534.1 cdc42 effector protein 2-like [Denticeps clupeoides]XP_028840535.1 cdc42 effector protein 2-like [Denticeps clupeoides]XP_028840536.1 cdc42 effector protein 2-like [Denticeps clupeoides]